MSPATIVHPLPDADLYIAESRSRPGHLHFVICNDGAWYCTCEATTTCHHIREAIAAQPSPLEKLRRDYYPLGRGGICHHEIRDVTRAREAGESWNAIGVALGIHGPSASRRYSPYMPTKGEVSRTTEETAP